MLSILLAGLFSSGWASQCTEAECPSPEEQDLLLQMRSTQRESHAHAQFAAPHLDTLPDNASKSLLIERIETGYSSASNQFDPTKPIKTCMKPGYTSSKKTVWGQALQKIKNSVPCIATDFEEMDYASGCLLALTGDVGGCFSGVGAVSDGASTAVNLDSNCNQFGTALHFIGRALNGGQHVTVHWDNIQFGAEMNFNTAISEDTIVPYDIGSAMHYSEMPGQGQHAVRPGRVQPVIPRSGEIKPFAKQAFAKERGQGQHADPNINWFERPMELLASVYGCTQHLDTVCPSDECIQHECVCHQTADNTPIVKQMRDGCSRCIAQCTDCGGTDCACPMGCQAHSQGGLTYCVREGTTSCLTGEPIDFTARCQKCEDLDSKHCTKFARFCAAYNNIEFLRGCPKTCKMC